MMKGMKKLIYSNHYPLTLVVEFDNLPKGWIAKDKYCSWNKRKPEGWEQYKYLIKKASEKIDLIIANEELTNIEVAKSLKI